MSIRIGWTDGDEPVMHVDLTIDATQEQARSLQKKLLQLGYPEEAAEIGVYLHSIAYWRSL